MMRFLAQTVILFASFILILAGCVDIGGEVAPTRSPLAIDSSQAIVDKLPTAPSATHTPAAAPPILTAQPTPQATTTPIKLATRTSSSQTPVDAPSPLPTNVNPLTGEIVADLQVLNRRPLAIKISNSPRFVRPQAGLNSADLVFEHLVEGSVTRLTAIFYSQDAPVVGSIRSSRLIDLELPLMYDAALAYSTSRTAFATLFRNSTFFNRIVSPTFGHPGFYRDDSSGLAFEHTLFTSTERIRTILDERGENSTPVFGESMLFSAEPPASSQSAISITISYPLTTVNWQHDSTTNRYLRTTDGRIHRDANDNAPLAFANIIVPAVIHSENESATLGNQNLDIQLWQRGLCTMFRDGKRYDGFWARESPNDMLTFYTFEGAAFPLAIGNTFIQIVPDDFAGLSSE